MISASQERLYAGSDSLISAALVGAVVMATPFISFVYFPAIYLCVGLLFFWYFASILLAEPNSARFEYYFPLALKHVVLLLLMFVHFASFETVRNIISIIFIDVSIMLGMLHLNLKKISIRSYARGLCIVLIATLVLGTAFSVFASRYIEITNPIESYAAGGRFLLLSNVAGHSSVIEIGFIVLSLAVSNVIESSLFFRWTLIVAGAACLLVSRTAVGYLTLFWIFSVYLIEMVDGARIKGILYMALFTFSVYLFFDLEFLQDIMFAVRSIVRPDAIAQYQYDFTSGRSGLNYLMLEGALSAPFSGLGHTDPLLLYGSLTEDIAARVGAVSESPLRVAAKYGFPLLACIVLFVISPAINQGRCSRAWSRFTHMLIGCIIAVMFTNSTFEVAHQYNTIWYSVLLLFLHHGNRLQREHYVER